MLTINKIESEFAETVYNIQQKCYLPLLEKYKDYETSPAMETVEIISEKINRDNTTAYLFKWNDDNIGFVRIIRLEPSIYKVAALSVIPEYENKGIAQNALIKIEAMYPDAKTWILDTIEEEKKNLYLYEKLGYIKTGETFKINDNMTIIGYMKEL